MALDANGIWQYTEAETNAPFSTVLNRLAGSVSAAVGPQIHDTGWVAIPTALGSPWTSTLKARRIGSRVSWKGEVSANGTVWGAIDNPQTLVSGLDSRFVPIDSVQFLAASNQANSSATQFRCVVQSNGLVVARCNVTNYAQGVALIFDYLVD